MSMFVEVISDLAKGDASAVKYIAACSALWNKCLAEVDFDAHDIQEELEAKLGDWQFQFEQAAGQDRVLGKTLMAWTAFTPFYRDGDYSDEDRRKATILAKSFEGSMVSIEVKHEAKTAAEIFMLDL
ncbi:hypothetical protein [Herbaspirillum huttiense]|uniref:Uncharacterized protein n=1 Tax=Herbaspirillum huttiense subsp. lycopersici TaxID=3074428 RepID=A0ABU2EFY5_9BURK|nr:hypothetical protein [Herbaspirillum huttiense]MDR9847051.1 hypothetical protein [Herbaspirillum huttiense SE1]